MKEKIVMIELTVMSYMTEPKLIEDLMKMTTIKYMMN